MSGMYNPLEVFLSLIIAFLASHTALELSGQLASLPNARHRLQWLLGGAAAMGVGIWSMHFIGMIAFSLSIPIGYDVSTTAASLLVATAASFIALATVSRKVLSRVRLCAAGTIMGVGIAGMHYLGMAAMQMCPPIRYTFWVVAASVGIAIGASIAALWLAFALRASEQPNLVFKRFGASIVMGLAIAGMHYTGMAAANFEAGSHGLTTHQLGANWLVLAVLASSLTMLIGALVFIGLHTRRLLDSLKQAHSELHYLGTHDSLTMLPNRLELTARIQQAIDACVHGGLTFAVLFVDLDGFKTINDSLGHAVGDELLKVCADRLRRSLRHDGMVARIGGDEFVIVMDRLLEASAAGAAASSVLRELCQNVVINGVRLRVSASVGIAVFPRDGHNIETLLHNADVAMYSAKQSGRNTFRHFEPSMTTTALKTLIIQRDLQGALEEGQLSISFQPKFSVADRSVTGAEALLRWHHPDLGNISPLEFISIAERIGQIIPIGDWVIKEVCRMISDLDMQGLPAITIAINLSPIQFNVPDLVERIDTIVRSAGILPERIMFEITESVAMQNADQTAIVIRKFRAFGYDMAIDDFGTGYSSLAYLQQFKIKQIKLDRFFVHELDAHEREGTALVSTIVTLARALGMVVVAEGVETETQVDKLADLDCDQMQGFLLSKPLPAEAFQQFLSGVDGEPHHELQTV